jgi:hypothetical protein
LIFIKNTDILLAGDKWNIFVNFALDDYMTFVDTMKLVLDHIRQKIQVQKPKIICIRFELGGSKSTARDD